MQRIPLTHPEGRKAISMDSLKYETLKTSFLSCLKARKVASFQELLADVYRDLASNNKSIEGKLEWNLFWVTLDLEAKGEIYKDKSSSPIRYTVL